VDTLLRDRDSFLQDVRERLLQAQAYAKRHYDGHHRALEFSVGDWVLLRLLHRPAQSLVSGKRSKLSPRFAGPYQVLERIGAVAYRLQLPDGARIHDVFHVGVLKPWRGAPPASLPALPLLRHGRILLTPEQAIQAQLRRGSWWILIKWTGLDATEATWELVDDFKTRFPEFQLEDELFVGEGRDVMLGKVYQRKERPAGQSG
jgi:hypothetical protein